MSKIEELLKYEQPTKYIVESMEDDREDGTPILTAGQSFILGYTNETNHIFPGDKEPVIIFDDFTTSVQYVDFPFKVKSSAMKILHKTNKSNLKYMYYLLKNISIDVRTHKRYWISEISQLEVKDISIEEQEKIAHTLDEINHAIENRQEIIMLYEAVIESLFNELYSEQYPQIALSEIVDVRDGTHDSPQYLNRSEYILITGKNIMDEQINFDDVKYISEQDFNNINKRSKVDYEDIIMPMIGTIGNPVIIKDKNINYAIKNVALFKKSDNLYPDVLFSFLKSQYFTEYSTQKNKGGIQKFLALRDIREMPIKKIPLQEQKKYVEKIDKIKQAKDMIKKDVDDLNELLNAKMNEYFD